MNFSLAVHAKTHALRKLFQNLLRADLTASSIGDVEVLLSRIKMMGDETTGRFLAAQQAPTTTKLIYHRIDICPIPLIVPMHASQLLAFECGVGSKPTPHVIAMILAPRFWIFQGHLGQGATPRRGCEPGSRVRLAWLMRPSRYLHLPRGG